MDVKAFKLISGEEIIAKVTAENEDGSYDIENPMIIMLAQVTEKDVLPMPVAPWVLLAQTKDTIVLRADLIMHPVGDAPKMLADKFLEITSGIALS